jgi:hypothetical protein
LALKLVYSAVKGELGQALVALANPIAVAATGAIRDAAAQVKSEGRAAIASGGFGPKWQNALRVNVYPQRGLALDPAALAFHKIPYAGIFETGGRIAGKPLLWVPISGTPARVSGQRFTPKTFTQQIGPLVFFKSRKGLPLLASPISGRPTSKLTVARFRKGQAGQGSNIQLQPVFVGLPVVNIRARFNLHAVFQRAQASLGEFYLQNLKP